MIDRVLFLMEKYCDADVKCGPTNTESVLVGTVMSTGLAKEGKRFYLDTLCQQQGKERMSELLIEDLAIFKPNLVLYSTLGGPLGLQLNPTNEVLNEIRKRATLFTCLWDTVRAEEVIKQRWLPFTDFIGVWDSVITPQRFDCDPRVTQAYSAIDPRDFYDKKLERDIDVCFVGAIDPNGQRWPQRIRYINFLKQNGINVVVLGGQRQSRLSWYDYANILNRAKISLNWSIDPPSGTSQIKGRVFETMACGAMLMEDDGTETKRFFIPGAEFVIFDSPEDLLRKVCYYLDHEDERHLTARLGQEKVTNIYNARNMWGYIFEKMGFEIPERLAKDNNYLIHNKIMEGFQ